MENMQKFIPESGESEYQFLWRVGNAKKNGIYSGNWSDIADIINKCYREDESEYRTESAYRKVFNSVYDFYEAGVFNKFSEDDYLQSLGEQKRELERMKIQYRDERNAWQKQNYSDARVSRVLDTLENELKESGRIDFPDNGMHIGQNSENDMIILLSDLHIGESFDNYYGKYNLDVAKERLSEMIYQISHIRDMNYSQNCYVFLLGDCISGNFRRSIQVNNCENVVDQIKTACELISSFCYELTKVFEQVTLYSVAGNHSRLQLKADDDIKDERLDDIVAWSVGLKLSHVLNFTMCKKNIDNSLAVAQIRGKIYAMVHGDNGDPGSENTAMRIMSVIGEKPYAICCGHLHTNNFSDVNGIKIVRGGSLCGSGNQYTRSHNFMNKPEQMVMTVDKYGIQALYPIIFQEE